MPVRENVCALICMSVCVIGKPRGSTKSTVYQDDMFLCFLHELYRAGLCCAFCYFCKVSLAEFIFLELICWDNDMLSENVDN